MNKKRYDELEDIRNDISSLQKHMIALSKSVKKDVRDETNEQIQLIGDRGKRMSHALEEKVKENPGQCLLAAFAGGIVTSALLHRR